MARHRPKGRNVNGILLLDKPTGITSNEALQSVKRLFKARKAGHTGSLDPLASGLLPICLGEATKASGFLLDADKHYQVRCKLGEKTATGDAEGEVIESRPLEGVDAARIESVLAGFRGEIVQIPPMYSAVKHQGQRLYKLARQGVEVEREPRDITIHKLILEAVELPFFDLDVHCTKGTYVRTLAEDIGEALGCGAHVSGLRRLGVGPYDSQEMVTMERVKELSCCRSRPPCSSGRTSASMTMPPITYARASRSRSRTPRPAAGCACTRPAADSWAWARFWTTAGSLPVA